MKKALYGIAFTISLLIFGCGEILEDPPGSSITATDVTVNVNSAGTEATFIWNTDIPSTHQVEYGITSGLYPAITTRSTNMSNSHTEVIPNLSSNVTYYFRVTNSAEGADDYVSREYSFNTSTTITISDITSSPTTTGATITWTTSIETTHSIEYGTSTGIYTYSTVENTTPDTSHSAILSDLAPDTPYYYRIKCYHATFPDVISAEESFTTSNETAPTLAQKLRGIWIVGGLSTSAITSTVSQVDLFDPIGTPTKWYPAVTTITIPVSFAGVTSYGGKIYVIGGFDNTGLVRDLTQIYDIASNSWTTGNVLPQPRVNISAVTANNKIYVLGGSGAAAATYFNTGWAGNNTVYEYTPGSTWAIRGTLLAAGSGRQAVLYDDVIYNMGGRSATGTLASTNDGYSVSALTYTTVVEVALSAGRTGFSTVIYKPSTGPSVMLIMGGFSAIPAATSYYIFNLAGTYTSINTFQYLYYPFIAPSTLQTLSSNPLLTALGFGAAAIYGNTLYYFGGTDYPANGTTFTYSYNITSGLGGSWSNLTSTYPMPCARFGHAAVTINQ